VNKIPAQGSLQGQLPEKTFNVCGTEGGGKQVPFLPVKVRSPIAPFPGNNPYPGSRLGPGKRTGDKFHLRRKNIFPQSRDKLYDGWQGVRILHRGKFPHLHSGAAR
jgi:hypothetical protein